MKNAKLLLNVFGGDRFKEEEPLKYHTFLKAGGLARLFFIAFKTAEVIKIINSCRQLNIPFIFFGTGSKMLISEDGFDGLVIQNRTKDIEIVSIKGKVSKVGVGVDQAIVEADSGVTMNQFVEFLDSHGLLSEEFKGVSGTVGGNLFVFKPLQERAEKVKILNEDGEVEEIEPQTVSLRRHIVLTVILRIKAV